MSSEISSSTSENYNPNKKAKEAWQKVAKNFNANSKYFHHIFSYNERNSSKESFFGTSETSIKPKPLDDDISEFQFAHGLPIKDSDQITFSSGILSKLAINPEGNALVVWLGLIAFGFMYFVWILIARQAFEQLQNSFSWAIFDYSWDIIFIIDILVHGGTGFLEDGLLVTQLSRVYKRYVKSRWFFLDVACILPYPFASPSIPLLRLPRLLKIFRAKEFIRKVEWAISFPNVLRVGILVHTLMLLMHWFACFYFMVSVSENGTIDAERGWAYPFTANESEWSTLRRKYLHSLYWSCLTLTTIGEKQSPSTDVEYLCTMAAYFLGIFVFATVVGQVGNVITAQNENKQAYQKMMDHAKKFMTAKSIPKSMQQRVLRWYRFSRTRGTLTGDNDVNSLQMVPDSLKTELAIFVNLHTLRKVPIFQLVQQEFLHHLVLKMKSCIYTPNDYICRFGEVGKEMFIVNHGLLEVVSETGVIVARLKMGDFFGEIGVLNLNEGINKRVASVRSVGYSEVFILSADDLLQAMDYYPEAKQLLLLYGRKRFQETEKRKHSKCSSLSVQDQLCNQAYEPSTPQSRKRCKTAELLVSSAASAVGTNIMECVFSHSKTHPQEIKDEGEDVAEDKETTKDINKLGNLIDSLSSIVDDYKRNNSSSQNMIEKQAQIIAAKEEEIERLNSDIKLLMKKLEGKRDW